MRFSRIATLMLAGALTFGVVSGASAQGQGQGRRGMQAVTLPASWVARLKPTAEQEPKLKAAADAYRAEQEKIRALPQEERRAANMAARKTYEDAVKAALTEDQNKLVVEMRTEAREYMGLGPIGNQLPGLALTTEQKAKIKEIQTKYAPELEKARAGATDPAAGRQATREITMKLVEEVRAVLTPEQQKGLQVGRRPQNQ